MEHESPETLTDLQSILFFSFDGEINLSIYNHVLVTYRDDCYRVFIKENIDLGTMSVKIYKVIDNSRVAE